MTRNRRFWGVLFALVLPAVAMAATQTTPPPQRLAPKEARADVTPRAMSALLLLAAIGTEQETPASPFEPPGRPEDRPPTSPPGLQDPPNPPGPPPDRPPVR